MVEDKAIQYLREMSVILKQTGKLFNKTEVTICMRLKNASASET